MNAILTVKQVAALLQVSLSQVRRMIAHPRSHALRTAAQFPNM